MVKDYHAIAKSLHDEHQGRSTNPVYGMADYDRDNKIFQPESIIKHDASGKEIPISDAAFEAQKRMNKHPDIGKKYFKDK